MKKIWNNDVVQMYDDIKNDIEDFFDDIPEEGLSDDEIWNKAHEEIEINLECEEENLNEIETEGEIFLMGTLVRWDGSHSAYKGLGTKKFSLAISKAIESFEGDNLLEIYVDNGRTYISQLGHDNPTSPSVFEFRAVKGYDSLDDLTFEKDDDSQEILLTNSRPIGNEIAKVYGWEEVEAA